jgi:hypothetical protein
MTALEVQLPERLYDKAIAVAESQNLSMDMIVAASLAQWLARIIPDPYLEERAQRATGTAFSELLSQVPDVPPTEEDSL